MTVEADFFFVMEEINEWYLQMIDSERRDLISDLYSIIEGLEND